MEGKSYLNQNGQIRWTVCLRVRNGGTVLALHFGDVVLVSTYFPAVIANCEYRLPYKYRVMDALQQKFELY